MNSPRNGIAAAGNWIVDLVKVIDTYPHREGLANIVAESVSNGGGPYNVLKDLALLQVPFPLTGIGLLGQDPHGERVLSDCRAHGIRTQYLQQTDACYTSYTVVMSEIQGGKRTFFHHRGANQLLDTGHIPLQHLTDRIFYLGYLLLLDCLDQLDENRKSRAAFVLEEARALGMYTAVDLVSEASDRFADLIPPALPHVDYLFLNEYEASKLTGIPLTPFTKSWLKQVTAKILAMGVHQAVYLHFPSGAVVHTQSGEFLGLGSVDVPSDHVKGTSGAGDAFAAGVLAALHQGQSWMESLQQGSCVAAASLFHEGTSSSIQPLANCLELAAKYGRKDWD